MPQNPAPDLAVIRDEGPALRVPRGRPIDAAAIVRRFFTDADGKALVTTRWVRDNMPYKVSASHSRVFWYDTDVEAVLTEARRQNIPIKDVRLSYLEQVA